MQCLADIFFGATFTIRQHFHTSGTAIFVDGGDDAKTLQHALHGLQVAEIDLRQSNTDTFFLRALHRTICIEHAAHYAAIKIGRIDFHCHSESLVAGSQPKLQCQCA